MKITIEDYNNKLDQPREKCGALRSTICFLSLCRLLALICTLFVILCILLLCKAYIKFVLLWLEKQDGLVISATICFLFILVSLPISIGYIVLVVASGYLFGMLRGLLLVVVGANFGLLMAHNILRLAGHHHAIYKYTKNDMAQAIMKVISGPLCFKIVFCSRLTPIPFGLQNTIFALSNVSARVYHVASLFGLFPAQFVGVYVGSTLRSMQDVLENRHISSTTYFFATAQLMFGASLMIWLGTKARKELLKAIAEAESASTKVTSFSV
ncbi:transmembrane protein 64 [Anoplophora glabripennis]|uniref:transmembrane protein 64 n=1 Tax=Anoplophora glabripennis TaxID=217634 RepID=UPI000C7653A9|nr:transmembrane protein 64 [Anoplophora glabripennis]XP_023311419.1 transmembrane protein 64 [Anoplophora glabripennis]